MLDVLGTIGSLVVVLLLIVVATLAISIVVLVALAAMAGSMIDWRRWWPRLTRTEARLTLKLSGSTVPERRRAELSGGTPRLRRRFLLGGAEPRKRRGFGGAPRRSAPWGHRPLERRSKLL
ncbi:hypothetical protein ETD86_16330 [Nonomuraea turkmeniaca]|uniref:Uncharacterized protein n=1 Tax=Nonomuraea turkmeniaca TaxID=103838 RepID=A0A5S4FKL5_9ACTN|nr:hypothetical protein [Nonomuraea turkmeniaca]TMR21149.1 hypothetical protein ETD86_16330 [Nonomuraea turkmeniaca]